MKWPTVEIIRSFTNLPEGYSWDVLRNDEIHAAIDFFKKWFPSIAVGLGSAFLDAQFYEQKIALNGDTDRDILILVIRHGGEVAAMASWEKIDGANTIYARLGAVAKEHRKSYLAVVAQELGEKMGRHMGAGLIYGLATTTNPYMQQALERTGYMPVGITPGFDQEEVQPGKVRRVYEVIYAKRLCDPTEFETPPRENLTPRVASLYAAIFQDGSTL